MLHQYIKFLTDFSADTLCLSESTNWSFSSSNISWALDIDILLLPPTIPLLINNYSKKYTWSVMSLLMWRRISSPHNPSTFVVCATYYGIIVKQYCTSRRGFADLESSAPYYIHVSEVTLRASLLSFCQSSVLSSTGLVTVMNLGGLGKSFCTEQWHWIAVPAQPQGLYLLIDFMKLHMYVQLLFINCARVCCMEVCLTSAVNSWT